MAKILLLPAHPLALLRIGLNVGALAAIAGLGYASAAGLCGIVQGGLEAAMPAEPAVQRQPGGPAPRPHRPPQAYEGVLAANVFHVRRSDADAKPAAGGPQTQQVSPLRLSLRGTFSIGNTAFAIVVGQDGRGELVYQIGDCIPRNTPESSRDCQPGQGRLLHVELTAITVEYGGERVVIQMEALASADPQPNVPPPLMERGVPLANVGLPPLQGIRSGNTIDMHLASAEVEKAFENFSDIVRQALVVPYAKDGVNQGFQVQRIQPGSVFQRIGLQNMDVVRGVNGQALNSADQALRLFTVFRNERQVVLDVDRGGENLKLSYTIE